MSVSVVVVADEYAALAQLLPPANYSVQGGGHVYRFCEAAGQDLAFRDLDGEMLVEQRHFSREADAWAWATRHIRTRAEGAD